MSKQGPLSSNLLPTVPANRAARQLFIRHTVLSLFLPSFVYPTLSSLSFSNLALILYRWTVPNSGPNPAAPLYHHERSPRIRQQRLQSLKLCFLFLFDVRSLSFLLPFSPRIHRDIHPTVCVAREDNCVLFGTEAFTLFLHHLSIILCIC